MLNQGASLEAVARSIRPETPIEDAVDEIFFLAMDLGRKKKIKLNVTIINPNRLVDITE